MKYGALKEDILGRKLHGIPARRKNRLARRRTLGQRGQPNHCPQQHDEPLQLVPQVENVFDPLLDRIDRATGEPFPQRVASTAAHVPDSTDRDYATITAKRLTISIFGSWCARFESGTTLTRKYPGTAKKTMAAASFTRIA